MAQLMRRTGHPIPSDMPGKRRQNNYSQQGSEHQSEHHAQRRYRKQQAHDLAERRADVEGKYGHDGVSATELQQVDQEIAQAEAAKGADHCADEPATASARRGQVTDGEKAD